MPAVDWIVERGYEPCRACQDMHDSDPVERKPADPSPEQLAAAGDAALARIRAIAAGEV